MKPQTITDATNRRPARAGLKAMLLATRHAIDAQLRAQREGARCGYEERPATDDGQIQPTDDDLQQYVRFAVMEASSEALARIDHALLRLEAGRYGLCAECDEAIAPARLRALPFAVRCLECERRRERRGGLASRGAPDIGRGGSSAATPRMSPSRSVAWRTLLVVPLLATVATACGRAGGPPQDAQAPASAATRPAAAGAIPAPASPVTSPAPAPSSAVSAVPAGPVETRHPSHQLAPRQAPAAAPQASTSPRPTTPVQSEPPPVAPAPIPTYREVRVPEGTQLTIALADAVASDTSHVEDVVHGRMRAAVVVDGSTVIPAGAAVTGYVTEADAAGRVAGLARIGVRFTSVIVDGASITLDTDSVVREATPTHGKDAAEVGLGAGLGALVGAISHGRKGAVAGAAIGAGAGTAAVLSTRGNEVSLPVGETVTTTLTRAVPLRVPNR